MFKESKIIFKKEEEKTSPYPLVMCTPHTCKLVSRKGKACQMVVFDKTKVICI